MSGLVKYLFAVILFFSGIILYAQDFARQIGQAEALIMQNPEQARKQGLNMLSEKLTEDEKLRVLFLLTNSSNLTGKKTEAIHYGHEALQLAKNLDQPITEIKIYGVLGNIYQSIPLNEKTKEYLNKAEQLIEQSKLPDSLDYIKGNIYYLKGMNYANTLDAQMAEVYFKKSIQVYQSSKNPLAEINLKLAYLNNSFCEIELGKTQEAEKMLDLARVQLSSPENIQPPYSRSFIEQQNIYCDFGKAQLLSSQNKIAASNEILESILKKENKTDISVIRTDLFRLLADNYFASGDLKKYQQYQNLYNQANQNTIKNQKKLLDTLIREEDAINQKFNKKIKRKFWMYSLITGLFGTGILVFLILNLLKIKKSLKKLKNTLFN